MFVGRALLSLVLSVVCVFGGGRCPTGCDCNEKMYSVSCSNRGFENIPVSVPYYAKEINFSGNKLRSLGSRLFYKGLGISNLDFSLNAIDEIAQDAFLHIKHTVIELNLRGNRLSRIPTSALSYLANLRVLVLADNELEALISRSFEKLQNLKKLDVKGNWLEQVSENAFYGLHELLHLDLSGNKLKALTPSSLRNLNSIIHLDLSRNSLAKLHPNSMTHVSFIETLLLSENELELFDVGTSAELGRLRVLDMSHNKFVKLSATMFKRLKRLEKLNLKGNLVDEIEPDGFKNLGRLKYLDLSENRLHSIPGPRVWNGLVNLVTLSLARNAITEVSTYAFSGDNVLNSVKEIDLSYNDLATIHSVVFAELQTLEKIDLSHNQLTSIEGDDFVNIPNLPELYLNRNNLKTPNLSLFRVFFNSGNNDLMEKLGSYLKENPWHCDCHLHSIITSFLHEVGSDGNATSLEGAICSTPKWLKGRTFAWFALAESHNCTRKIFYPLSVVVIWTFPVIFLFCLLIMHRKTHCRNYFVLAVVIKPKRKRYDSYKRDKIL